MSFLVSHQRHEPTSDMASASIFSVFMFMRISLHYAKFQLSDIPTNFDLFNSFILFNNSIINAQ